MLTPVDQFVILRNTVAGEPQRRKEEKEGDGRDSVQDKREGGQDII
jgi:hypothetical protein